MKDGAVKVVLPLNHTCSIQEPSLIPTLGSSMGMRTLGMQFTIHVDGW